MFMVNHNHSMVEQKKKKKNQFLQSHRVMKNSKKAQFSAILGVGISQIMDYIV